MPKQEHISEFLSTAGIARNGDNKPSMPTDKQFKLLYRLIFEEALEGAETKGQKNYLSIVEELLYNLFKTDNADEKQEIRNAVYDFMKVLKKFVPSMQENNLVEFIDAMVDIVWMVGNGVYMGNLEDVYDKASENIRQSNMSKFCDTEEIAKESIEEYKNKGVETYYEQVGTFFVIYRKSDGKVLKSKYYTKADIKQFLQ